MGSHRRSAVFTHPKSNGSFDSAAFSPDGTLIASVDVEDGVRIWDISTGTERWNIPGLQSCVWIDQSTILSHREDQSIRVCRPGQPHQALPAFFAPAKITTVGATKLGDRLTLIGGDVEGRVYFLEATRAID
mmetsp:Transcript_43298/g.101909  ORF Transcript_43298/g.101909 Transcript_43298/m.101909 type:complete len:132 (-) Transcript_43298:236-631(-)